MADLLYRISVFSYILSAIFFFLAIIFLFFFRIPHLIRELLGRNIGKTMNSLPKNKEKQRAKEKQKNVIWPATKKTQYIAEDIQGEADWERLKKKVSGLETEVLTEENVTAPLFEEEQKQGNYGKEIFLEVVEEIIWIHSKEII